MMDCIPYINDLEIEIKILKDVRANGNTSLIDEQIRKKEELLNECKNNLSKLSDNQIEYRLYLALLSGLNPNKAVEKIADENHFNNIKPSSISGIWNYYQRLQKKLKKL